jgi:hypothetical protein
LDHRSNKVSGARSTISLLNFEDDDVVEVIPTGRSTTSTSARGRKTQNAAPPFASLPARGGRGRGGGRGSRGNKSSTLTTNGKQVRRFFWIFKKQIAHFSTKQITRPPIQKLLL